MGEERLVNGHQWLCTTAASICIVSCIVSLFTIAFIAIDRYLYICWKEEAELAGCSVSPLHLLE